MKKEKWYLLMILPAIAFICFFIFYPLFRGGVMAFQSYSLFNLKDVKFIGLDNIKAILFSKTVSFRLGEVLYLDIRDKELAVHTADGSVLNISVPLNSLLPKLPPEQFVRCYRSYIVSLPAVSSIWRYGIELKNGETIPLSRSYYAAVQNALMDWTAQH